MELLLRRARERSARQGVPLPRALAEVYEGTRQRVQKRLEVTAACTLSGQALGARTTPPSFLCDAGLGGLARWLRAAGYEAEWRAEATDAELVEEALRRGLTLVTADAGLMRRRPVRAGTVATVWVPSCMSTVEQLGMVLRDLGLELRAARCMACGGALRSVPKAEVRERIPPRTRAWKDEYFLCEGCGTLLWQGTHWQRILIQLEGAAPRPPGPPRASLE